MKHKKEHPVNNTRMYELVCSYIETGVFSNELGKMFMTICTMVSTNRNFCSYRYHDKDDMKQDALVEMISALKNYKKDRVNPFAYFQTIAYNAFLHNLRRKYGNDNLKQEILETFVNDNPDLFKDVLFRKYYNKEERDNGKESEFD